MGETGRRLSESMIDHSGCDKNSHVLKHCIEKEHKLPIIRRTSLEEIFFFSFKKKKN